APAIRSRAASMSLNVITLRQLQREIEDRQDRDQAARGIAKSSGFEGFANFGGELFGIERFGQEKHSRRAAVARGKRFFKISGDEKNFDVRVCGAERIGKLASAGLRHDQIGEE